MKYDIVFVLTSCWILGWLLSYPIIPPCDTYFEGDNQWGILITEEVTFIRWMVDLILNHVLHLNVPMLEVVYHFPFMMFHNVLLFVRAYLIFKGLKQCKRPYVLPLFSFVVFFFIVTWMLWHSTNDLAFISVTFLFIALVINTKMRKKNIRFLQFMLFLVLAAICISYRKNAILILPALVYPVASIYNPLANRHMLIKVFVSTMIPVLISLPLTTNIMLTPLGLKDSQGAKVFMASDIVCMRMIQGRDYGEFTPISHPQNNFIQTGYVPYQDIDDVKKAWINTIANDPSTFVKTRFINYIQFLTIACLPSSFAQYLRNKYNIVIYDASNYYCTKQGIQCIGPSDKDYYCGTRLSTIGLPIKERMNINYDNLYQPWWVTAFVINVCYYFACKSI